MRRRVYAETSVFGGCHDAKFRSASLRFFELVAQGGSTLILSDLTLRELQGAPEAVQEILAQIPNTYIESVQTQPEAERLADAYVTHGAIGQRMHVDAVHIALATISRAEVLVSWNFKHIVNLRRIFAYNKVNTSLGYPELEIRTPSEIIEP